jgi:hypothetical protein
MQSAAIDPALARQYFEEARALSEKDGGKLWGVPLYGPMLFVDSDTRAVVANQAAQDRKFHQEGDVFIGSWPKEENISNTAMTWAGVKWTMVMWPLPGEKQVRGQLMMHELFHRIQSDLHLSAKDPANRHLDTQNGRIWLRLEWRALERALPEQGTTRQQAISDALYFRRHRRQLFPQAAADEQALEINEGLAEYTGYKLSTRSLNELSVLAAYGLHDAPNRRTFMRSFAYASGPAYGALLDATGAAWRKAIKPETDFGEVLQQALAIKLTPDSESEALMRAKRYDGEEVIAAEVRRETTRQMQLAKNRARFLDGPVLMLPLTSKVNYSYNPNNLVTLDDVGTVYPTIRVTDDWGIIEASDGALMIGEGGRMKNMRVTAPGTASAVPIQGKGWKLELNAGWALVPGEREGDLVVRKQNQ